MARKARRVVQDLFSGLRERPECLPADWRARLGEPDEARTAQAVADYIAGMTDRFAFDEHEHLMKPTNREP